MKCSHRAAYRRLFIALAASLVVLTATLLALAVAQIDLIGPPGSESFGGQVIVLSTGNIVVTDPNYDAPGSVTDTGAVYLYNGATGALISQMTGSTVNDRVGEFVMALGNGNYVVLSAHWDNGSAVNAGAVTWGNGMLGLTGTVSAANSLVGNTAYDRVGEIPSVVLHNGNYVVQSPYWNNGVITDAGAVTWGDGALGVVGIVSTTNSLVGSTLADKVGFVVVALSNGNYVVGSTDWDNGLVSNVGAVTWGNGLTGITGVVSITNSLVGNQVDDRVGNNGIQPLSNGNYLVGSANWDNGVVTDTGAVTWCRGTASCAGVVTHTNSLVGSTVNDQVGSPNLIALSNGNYVIGSRGWDNGGVVDVGAVTWGNGLTGITGVVSITNSLVGSVAGDRVGHNNIRPLSNGNYVVESPYWNNGVMMNVGAVTWGNGTKGITGVVSITNSLVGHTAGEFVGLTRPLNNGNYVVISVYWDNGSVPDVGAVTWANGLTGITGVISITNSLVGSTANDYIGGNVVQPLSNGNYVVPSPNWDNGVMTDAGAMTWGNGLTGITGVVSITNSLVGSTADDQVGNSVYTLTNGNYVAWSPNWDNGVMTDTGAVTWGNGTKGITGVVSLANSLVGSTANDQVGSYGLVALSNGNYVVRSPTWDNGAAVDAGAVTWGDGTKGITGVVSIANSLVGSATDDRVGRYEIRPLTDGNYVVLSPEWDNGAEWDAGAVTWGDGRGGTAGPITAGNSVRGSAEGGGSRLNFDYDYIHAQLVVGRPADNVVTLFGGGVYQIYLPLVRK